MKLQKSLSPTENENLMHYVQKILLKQKQILDQIRSRETEEQNLGGFLIENMKSQPEYPKFKNILDTVLFKTDKKEGNLISCICMQIAESLAKYYETPEDKQNAGINWGAEFYDIPYEEIEKTFGVGRVNILNIKNQFGELNNFLNQYGVELFNRNYNPIPKGTMCLVIKIFLTEEESK